MHITPPVTAEGSMAPFTRGMPNETIKTKLPHRFCLQIGNSHNFQNKALNWDLKVPYACILHYPLFEIQILSI